MLQIVPVPATAAYKRGLERRIQRAWSNGVRMHNSEVIVTNSRSLDNLDQHQTAKRAVNLTAVVSRFADNASKAAYELPNWDKARPLYTHTPTHNHAQIHANEFYRCL